MNDLFKMNERTSEFDPQDAKNAKAMGILSYIGLLALIPYFTEKNSPWARFHAIQGLNLFIAGTVVNIALTVISSVLGYIPYVGAVFSILLAIVKYAVSLGCSALCIIGIVHAATGRAVELPVIKNIKILNK